MEQNLDNKEYIFVLLTSLIKREGGELRISEEQILNVYNSDVVTLLWDGNSREIVLQIGESETAYTTVPDKNNN
tara:strand:- start:199 stop:420 length:222 start_codon:yes stop_codon:yes gene_type:complete